MIELINGDCMDYMRGLPDKYFEAAKLRLENHQRIRDEIKEVGYSKTELEKTNPILF